MIKLPVFFSKKKLLLAFEYALIISETARKMRIKVTTKLSERAEEMILNEFSKKNPTQLAVDMYANVLSIFETNMDKVVSTKPKAKKKKRK